VFLQKQAEIYNICSCGWWIP